jgi:5,6-dimethylbenzimidazole synthase
MAGEGFNQVERYDVFMDVVQNRMTNRAFDPDYVVPKVHHEMILDAARHGPSGARGLRHL